MSDTTFPFDKDRGLSKDCKLTLRIVGEIPFRELYQGKRKKEDGGEESYHLNDLINDKLIKNVPSTIPVWGTEGGAVETAKIVDELEGLAAAVDQLEQLNFKNLKWLCRKKPSVWKDKHKMKKQFILNRSETLNTLGVLLPHLEIDPQKRNDVQDIFDDDYWPYLQDLTFEDLFTISRDDPKLGADAQTRMEVLRLITDAKDVGLLKVLPSTE